MFQAKEAIAELETMRNIGMADSWIQYMTCGSARRGRTEIKDLDVLVYGDYDSTLTWIQKAGLQVVVGKDSAKKHLLRFYAASGLLIDLMFVELDAWGSAAMHHTGPVELNIKQRAKAKSQGLALNQFGLWAGTEKIAGATEREVYQALGMDYLEPKDREKYAARKSA